MNINSRKEIAGTVLYASRVDRGHAFALEKVGQFFHQTAEMPPKLQEGRPATDPGSLQRLYRGTGRMQVHSLPRHVLQIHHGYDK